MRQRMRPKKRGLDVVLKDLANANNLTKTKWLRLKKNFCAGLGGLHYAALIA